MATRPTELIPFKQGNSEIPRPIPSSVNALSLAASTAESMTIPTGARYVVLSANADFYVNFYTTATVPGDVTNGTASEQNPTGYELPLQDVPTLSVISPSACIVTAAFYA